MTCICGLPIQRGTTLPWVHSVNPGPRHHYAVPAEPTLARLMKSVRRAESGCWEWVGRTHGAGRYGAFSIRRHQRNAHRVAYELMVGPVAPELQLDHLCRNTLCVNPDHLEPVTPAENTRRGVSFAARNGRKTHCSRGHEYTPENTYRIPSRPNARYCRTCNNDRSLLKTQPRPHYLTQIGLARPAGTAADGPRRPPLLRVPGARPSSAPPEAPAGAAPGQPKATWHARSVAGNVPAPAARKAVR